MRWYGVFQPMHTMKLHERINLGNSIACSPCVKNLKVWRWSNFPHIWYLNIRSHCKFAYLSDKTAFGFHYFYWARLQFVKIVKLFFFKSTLWRTSGLKSSRSSSSDVYFVQNGLLRKFKGTDGAISKAKCRLSKRFVSDGLALRLSLS